MPGVRRVARLIMFGACSLLAAAMIATPVLADDGGPGPLRFAGPLPPTVGDGRPGPPYPGHHRRRPPDTTTPTTAARRTPPGTGDAPGHAVVTPPAPPTPPPGAHTRAVPPATGTAASHTPVTAPAHATSPSSVTPPVVAPSHATLPSTPHPSTTVAPATRPVAASRADASGGIVHHSGPLQGQALAALLAFAGLLALGTFLRRFRPPVT